MRGLSDEEVERALGPVLFFRAQLEEEMEWYERVRRRDFEIIDNLSAVGKLLIALRIANGLSQRELAEMLGVSKYRATSETSTTASPWSGRRRFWTPWVSR